MSPLTADGPDPDKDRLKQASGSTPPELEELRGKAEELQERGEWGEESLAVNERIFELEPANVDTRTRLARCLIAAGRPCEAVDHFAAALELDPGEPNIEQFQRDASRDCKAMAEIERLDAEHGLDGVRDAADRAGDSERDLRFAVLARQFVAERDPSAASIGAWATTVGEHRELHVAEDLFKRSLELDPSPQTNAATIVGLAAMRREQHRVEETRELCEQVLAADPENAGALSQLCELECDLAEAEHSHEHLARANEYADKIWLSGKQGEATQRLYARMKRIYDEIQHGKTYYRR